MLEARDRDRVRELEEDIGSRSVLQDRILEALDMRVRENNLVLTVGMWLQDEEYEDDGKAHEY